MAIRAQTGRNLHLTIDPSGYRNTNLTFSPDSSPSSSSPGTDGTTPTSTGSEGIICAALCLYDFQSKEPIHLPFRKNEILDVIKQEDTGWWAAMRPESCVVGWIPEAFVKPLSEEMAERLLNVREELRVYEYEAEQLYNAPVSRIPIYDPDPDPVAFSPRAPGNRDQPLREPQQRRLYPPPSPVTPMPRPPPSTSGPSASSAPINKPTPPTPTDQQEFPQGRDRSVSAPDTWNASSRRPQPMSTLTESDLSNVQQRNFRPGDKITRITGSDDARAFAQTLQLQTHLPWYLRPKLTDQLQIDSDGQVRSGSLAALVEKLVWDTSAKDPIKTAQDTSFRNVFLMTFRTFVSAEKLFDVLVGHYRMEPPPNLTTQEMEEWKDKLLLPSQCRVLTIFTVWLEDHRLLEEEPQIAQPLTKFLKSISSPPPQALTANLIINTIERLTFASPSSSSSPVNKKSRKSKPHKGELLRLDPLDIAEQLALMEHALYEKITPQECIKYARTQSGKSVAGLTGFCATHDRLVAWVQSTILGNEQLGKRADTVDFWIKVAEKCRSLNNFASMSGVLTALSSTVITRLHLTWAHVSKKSTFDALLKFNTPTGSFSGYRGLQQNIPPDSPCTPFIGMYLTDIVHIHDQWEQNSGQVNFVQCQRWSDVIRVMLRFQDRRYEFGENESTYTFISGHIRNMSVGSKDQSRLWARSQEVQQSELAHADIRRGLEAAGF